MNRGSRSTAKLIFTVPDRVCHASMSATKSAGSASRSTSRRKEILGWAVVMTVSARISSPSSRVTPTTAPSRVSIRATGAPVRICAPNARAAPAIAPVTPPIPPAGKPHAVSPTWWCSITYAVPALRGPAQVPITPETDSTPRMASETNRSSTRSAMLDVNSRVRSNAARTSTCRSLPSSAAWPARSAGFFEPSFGGISSSSGPTSRPSRPSHSSHRWYASTSALWNLAISSRRRTGSLAR